MTVARRSRGGGDRRVQGRPAKAAGLAPATLIWFSTTIELLVNRARAGERDPTKQKVQIARTASDAATLAESLPAVRRIGDLEVVVKGEIS